MRRILVALALGVSVTSVLAADQTILGKRLLVKDPSTPDKRRITGDAREWPSPNEVVGNPTLAGATLTIRVDGDHPSEQTFPLPQGRTLGGKPFWTGTSTDNYKYKDAKGEQGPVGAVQIRRSTSGVFQIKVKISGKYASVSVVP